MTLLETSAPRSDEPRQDLKRNLTLPWLVFYGVGVTVGAGIFALIGELLGVAGNGAPIAFLIAGAIAGVTSLSYRDLVARMPRAGGEAIWVSRGIGEIAGRATGTAVVIAGIVSSAVVALAFGGYVAEVIPLNAKVAGLVAIALLVGVAAFGARESIALAGVVTLLEVGTLLIIVGFGAQFLDEPGAFARAVTNDPPIGSAAGLGPMFTGAVLAFFAFIGFEDIVNMAEETVDPERTAPRAIAWTLGLSVIVYVLLAFIAINVADPNSIAESDAPMAALFEAVSGLRPEVIAAIAAIAMTNGILAQVMMSSRVVYGMASEGTLGPVSAALGRVHHTRRTPIVATIAIGVAVAVLVVFVPLVRLARTTSLLILGVFTMVNVAQARLARGEGGGSPARGIVGAMLCVGLLLWEVANLVGGE